MDKPNSRAKNLHHTGTYFSEEDFYNENLGKGPGDPDIYGYPGEPEEPVEAQPYKPLNDRPF